MLSLLTLILAMGFAVPSRAQSPPDANVLSVGVTIDKDVPYLPGEEVKIRVSVTNLSNAERVLQFRSSLQADYVIDGWRWSDDKAFTTGLTAVTVRPGATYSFPEFVHRPGDFYLVPGRHELVAEVRGYGAAKTLIPVIGEEPEPGGFLISPSVSPNPVPFGRPVELGVTVTNVSNAPLSFGHDGCPVLFTIDDSYKPSVACAEYWTRVTLEPGQSIGFNGAEFPYLILSRNATGYTPGPGWHHVDFQVPGVGTTSARFQVTGDGSLGVITGHVIDADGATVSGAVVEALPFAPFDSSTVPGDRIGYQAVTGPDGSYRIEQIPAGTWAVRAYRWNSGEIWYDGHLNRPDADPVTVTENSATEGIDFVLPSVPPPPPPFDAIITGYVSDDPGDTKRPQHPLPEAVVAAFPVESAGVDTGWVPPDSTNARAGAALSSRDVGDPTVPPPQPWPGRPVYFGFPDSLGAYTIHLPLGQYKVIAIAPGYRYEWWQETPDFADADDVTAHANWLDSIPPSISFTLLPVPAGAPQGSVAGRVTGIAYPYPVPVATGETPPPGGGLPPDTIGVARPLAGATVVAVPFVRDPRILTFRAEIYTAKTGDDGSYTMEVPVGSPYIVSASAEGYGEQYFDHVPGPYLATPVDVRPGGSTPDVDFLLGAYGPPPDLGMISGIVISDDPRVVGPIGRPLPGALVRVSSASPSFAFEMVTRSDGEGRFTFFGIPATDGSAVYRVSAEAPDHLPLYYRHAFDWDSADPVVPSTANSRVAPVMIELPLVLSETPYFAVGLVRSSADIIVGQPPDPGTGVGGGGSTGPGGGGGGEANSAGPGDGSGAPADTTIPYLPLPGAFLYLVSADENDTAPVAGGVACDNGTLVINNIPAGRYKAYADRPGFAKAWFHGTNRLDAAVVTIGPGIDPVVIDITLEPLFGTPPPPGGGGSNDAAPRTVTDIRNSPNPFQPQTTIIYRLMDAADVSLAIYDVNGRLVRRLFDGIRQSAGEQHIPWDGRSDTGEIAGAGIYFYRITTPAQTSTGKMVRIR